MFSLRLTTNTERKDINVDEDLTPKAVLDDNGISLQGATVSFDGMSISATEMCQPFSNLIIDKQVHDHMLAVVVKADSAL